MRIARILGRRVPLLRCWRPSRRPRRRPTFAKDVAPILYSKCVECHRPTMFAPMSLVKYDEARPWAKSIKQPRLERTMPPWGADPQHGVFKNDPRLTDKEISTILAWVDGGAPKGEDKDMPAMPSFTDGLDHRRAGCRVRR